MLFTKDGKVLHSYPADRGGTVYAIPAGVTSIGEEAFQYCGKLKPEVGADIEKRFGVRSE
ncbi:MAG: leucine-rich repeat domain-containing protein [Spirochaetaceae bacterium]|nr:leucine-rich repeat domain-containing protein [Spirochaetaceae bacterium]